MSEKRKAQTKRYAEVVAAVVMLVSMVALAVLSVMIFSGALPIGKLSGCVMAWGFIGLMGGMTLCALFEST